jgi:hypothetical protein
MKVFQVNYFERGFERVSIVTNKDEEQAAKMVMREEDFELISIREWDLSRENIIHTTVIETV